MNRLRSHNFHRAWLKVSALTIAAFSPLLFLATIPGLSEPARLVLDVLAWPVDGFPSYEPAEMRFLSALTGGFLLGWGATVWCLSAWAYDTAPEGVRKSMVAGACLWFALDSAGSIASGNGANAWFNVGVLLLVVGPLWLPAER